MKFNKYMRKIIKLVPILIFCIFLTSCKNNEIIPEYLIECKNEDSFTGFGEMYYTIENNTIKKVSYSKYNKHINNSNYESLSSNRYKIWAQSSFGSPKNWSYWEFGEYSSDKRNILEYDIEKLKKYVTMMDLDYETPASSFDNYVINIYITEFDDYTIIEANLLKNEKTIKSKCALFYDEELVNDNYKLSSVQEIYKYN